MLPLITNTYTHTHARPAVLRHEKQFITPPQSRATSGTVAINRSLELCVCVLTSHLCQPLHPSPSARAPRRTNTPNSGTNKLEIKNLLKVAHNNRHRSAHPMKYSPSVCVFVCRNCARGRHVDPEAVWQKRVCVRFRCNPMLLWLMVNLVGCARWKANGLPGYYSSVHQHWVLCVWVNMAHSI